MFKLAFRNLARNKKKTILIGSLIAAGMFFLFTANAVFESSNRGLEASFIRSLTGDAAICAESDIQYGLFGNEVPIVSSYESIPAISGYKEISSSFSDIELADAWSPVVSAAAYLEIENFRMTVPVFGVDSDSYFEVCSDIIINSGDISSLKDEGIFLNTAVAEKVEKKLGRKLEAGDELRLSMYSNGSFRLRRGYFAGVHSYVSSTEVLDRVVLADPTLVRSIANYTMGYGLKEDTGPEADEDDDFELDSLFSGSEDADTLFSDTSDEISDLFTDPEISSSETEDLDTLFSDASEADISEKNVTSDHSDGFSLSDLEDLLSDTEERDSLVMTDSAAWSFVIFKTESGNSEALKKQLEKAAEKNGWEVRVLDWRDAAGLSAQIVFALQYAFYIGMIFIGIGAVIVIMNALVISVLERSSEIGTMRGLGASSGFIRTLFISESMILTMTSAFAGIILGIIFSFFLSFNGIRLENELLINMFGGNIMKPVVTLSGIMLHILTALVIASIAWIYPVSVALKINPVSIMGKD